MKSRTKTCFSLLLGIILLVLFFLRTNPEKVWFHLKEVNWWWVLLGTFFNMISVLLRALRWKIMLSPVAKCPLRKVIEATFIGYALSTLFPARIGEVVRPLFLAGEVGFSRVASLSSALLERVLDVVVLIVMVFIALHYLGPGCSSPLVERLRIGSVWGGIIIVSFLVFIFFLTFIRIREGILKIVPSGVSRTFFENLFTSFSFLKPGFSFATIILLGIAIWLFVALNAFCFFMAFDMDLDFPASLMVISLMGAGFLVPSPGGVGGVHKAVQIGLLEFYRIEINLASAYALILHAVSMIPLTIIGLIVIIAGGISPAKLLSLNKK